MSTTVRVSTPGELAGTIPYLLGFTPDEGSLVYLTIGKGPLARLDMTDDVRNAIGLLLPMWHQHPPQQAALVFYTSNPHQAVEHAAAISHEVQRRGGQIVATVRVHDGVCQHLADNSEEPIDKTPPAAAAFVVKGVAPLENREAAAARLHTDEDHITQPAFEAALEVMKTTGKAALRQAAEDILTAMRQYLEDGTLPTDRVIPTFALALQAKPVRDLAWCELRRSDAERYMEFFLHLYRRCPVPVTAPIASLTAFAAWLDGGHAPVAWAATDRALEVDPDYTMAHLVVAAMTGVMDPAQYESLDGPTQEQIWAELR